MESVKSRLKMLQYNPRVKVIKRGQKTTKYWFDYFLPDGTRVQRSCCDNHEVAENRAKEKTILLLNGDFDEEEVAKLCANGFIVRLPIQFAMQKYSDDTEDRKRKGTVYNDTKVLEALLRNLPASVQFLDQISQEVCAGIKRDLVKRRRENFLEEDRGKGITPLSAVTINDYLGILRKFFHHFHKTETILENPMRHIEDLPVTASEAVRAVVIPKEDIQTILDSAKAYTDSGAAPLDMYNLLVVAFNTGMRRGELLHLEFEDLKYDDKLKGYCLALKYKPTCPTALQMGWRPKNGIARKVGLNEVAYAALQGQPRRETVGRVQGTPYPGKFIFPKKVVSLTCGKKCTRCTLKPDTCGFRLVTYERCDSFDRSWMTILKQAGLEGKYVFKDIRSTYNTMLVEETHLTHKEAGMQIGNTEPVNRAHYTGVIESQLMHKVCSFSIEHTSHIAAGQDLTTNDAMSFGNIIEFKPRRSSEV